MKRKISQIDWLIYRLFRWRWNRIFEERPDMWEYFVAYSDNKKGEEV